MLAQVTSETFCYFNLLLYHLVSGSNEQSTAVEGDGVGWCGQPWFGCTNANFFSGFCFLGLCTYIHCMLYRLSLCSYLLHSLLLSLCVCATHHVIPCFGHYYCCCCCFCPSAFSFLVVARTVCVGVYLPLLGRFSC